MAPERRPLLEPARQWLGRLSSPERRAARVLAGYAVFGMAWVTMSDRVLLSLSPDVAALSALGMWKGLAFILFSTLLLFFMLVAPDGGHRRPAARAGSPGASGAHGIGSAETSAGPGAPTSLAMLFAVLGAAVVGAGLVGVAASSTALRDAELDELQGFAASRVELASRWREARFADAAQLAREPQLVAAVAAWMREDTPDRRERVVAQLRAARRVSEYDDVAVLDGEGRVLVTSSGRGMPLAEGTPLIVRQAVAGGRTLETGFRRVGPDGGVRDDVIAPMQAAPGHAPWALVMRADPTRSLLSQVDLARTAGNRRATLFGRVDGGRYAPLSPSSGRASADAGAALGAWIDAHDADIASKPQRLGPAAGQPATGLGVAVRVPDTPWVVVARSDERRLEAALLHRAAWIGAIDVLVFAVAAVLVIVTWQRRELQARRGQAEAHEATRRALSLLDAIANGSTDVIYAKDVTGRFLFVNDELCRVLGRPREEIVGRRCEDVLEPVEARRLWRQQEAAMRGGVVSQAEGWSQLTGAPRYYLEVKGPLRDGEGGIAGIFGIARDATARKQEEDRMRQWAAAMAATREGVLITDLQGRIMAVNRAFTTITGYEESDVLGRTPAVMSSGRHDDGFYRAMWRALLDEGRWQGEIWNRRRCGEVYPEWLTIDAVRDPRGETTHYVAVFADITGAKRHEAQLERLAHYDPLTELPNRTFMQQRIDQALAHVDRHKQRGEGGRPRVAVLTLDLDQFKHVNDSWDHTVGDELLVTMARRLHARLRAEDTLGRLGGDEFVVLVDDVGQAGGITSLANDLLDSVSQPVQLSNGREVRLTASLGIALYPDDGAHDASHMLRNADAAMYRAKEGGRNRFSFYTANLNTDAAARLEMETALAHAVERGELALHYQAKVDARTGAVEGAEALLRWFRPGGLVSPAKFIPVLEEGPLVFEIGAWVIDQACAQLRAWRDAGLPLVPVSVNVTARQFAAGDLDLVVARALEAHDVPPELLVVELTESTLLDHGDETMLLLHRLKARGVQLSLDDFGTGYSSLAYLHKFPIDEVKIDRAFVRDIGVVEDGAAITDMVLALARRLKLRVVAEGVETTVQQDYLRRNGCDLLQGFLYSRPAPAEALQALIAERAFPEEPASSIVPLRAT